MPEKYKPSPEEVAKAEGMMVKEQKDETRYRERHAARLEAIGKKGHLSTVDVKPEDGEPSFPSKHKMVGELNGHQIELIVSDLKASNDIQLKRITADKITGTVDGEELSAEDALKLYMKYWEYADSSSAEYTREKVNKALDKQAEEYRQDNLKKGPVRKTVDELLA